MVKLKRQPMSLLAYKVYEFCVLAVLRALVLVVLATCYLTQRRRAPSA